MLRDRHKDLSITSFDDYDIDNNEWNDDRKITRIVDRDTSSTLSQSNLRKRLSQEKHKLSTTVTDDRDHPYSRTNRSKKKKYHRREEGEDENNLSDASINYVCDESCADTRAVESGLTPLPSSRSLHQRHGQEQQLRKYPAFSSSQSSQSSFLDVNSKRTNAHEFNSTLTKTIASSHIPPPVNEASVTLSRFSLQTQASALSSQQLPHSSPILVSRKEENEKDLWNRGGLRTRGDTPALNLQENNELGLARKGSIVSFRTRCFSMTIESGSHVFDQTKLREKEQLYEGVAINDDWFDQKIKDYRAILRKISTSTDIALREQYELFSRLNVCVRYIADSDFLFSAEKNAVISTKNEYNELKDAYGEIFESKRSLAFLSMFIDCVLLFVAFPLTCSDVDINFLISNNFVDVLIAQTEEELDIALKLDASAFLRTLRSATIDDINAKTKDSNDDVILRNLTKNSFSIKKNFVIFGNNLILNVDSREPRRIVKIKDSKYLDEITSVSRLDESEDRYRADNRKFSFADVKRKRMYTYNNYRTLKSFNNNDDEEERTSIIETNRKFEASKVLFCSGANRSIPSTAPLRHSLSKEQLEIVRLYEAICYESMKIPSPPASPSSISEKDQGNLNIKKNGNVVGKKILKNRDESSSSTSTISISTSSAIDRRLIIDGVAGAGKTFVLGYFLERFKTVQYLVKKRMFIQNVKNRFPNVDNLRASTIDSFLMKALGVRELSIWLDMLKTSLDSLCEKASRNAENYSKNTLYFIDEFGQIEGTLALILNIFLRNCNVILVGDTNQQSAINETINCPVQTLLGYRNIAFMYENTRAKDINLLRRLSQFYFKQKDESIAERILAGLPTSNLINLQPFLDSFRRDEYDYSLLPKVIVTSNEQTNFINWAIGKILWINARPNKKLKYTREIIRAVEKRPNIFRDFKNSNTYIRGKNVTNVTITTRDGVVIDTRGENVTTTPSPSPSIPYDCDLYDDPYADEHFVLVGMYYRIIFNHRSYPFEVGTRVVVTRIESDTAVWIKRAETYRSSKYYRDDEFRITKLRVKPYEFKSVWHSMPDVDIFMFPFVSDQATTIYQIQGITLSEKECSRCYIDAYRMDERSLYVALSRFESERQIVGVINSDYSQ